MAARCLAVSLLVAIGSRSYAQAARPMSSRSGQIHAHRVVSDDLGALRQEASWLEKEKERLAAQEDYASAAVIQKRLKDVQAELEAGGAAATRDSQLEVGAAEDSARQSAGKAVMSSSAFASQDVDPEEIVAAAATQSLSNGRSATAGSMSELHADFRAGGAHHALFQRASQLLADCVESAIKDFAAASEDLKQAHDTLLTLHDSSFAQVFRGYPPTDEESPKKVQDFLRNMVDATFQLAVAGDGQEDELRRQATHDCSKDVVAQLH